jgi:hypothetical protein
MAYIYPTGAVLGSSKAGAAIGYRLVNSDTTEAQAFTTNDVVETAVPGTYTVVNGVSLPDGFAGRIEWGTVTTKYADEWIGPGTYEKSNQLYTPAGTLEVKLTSDGLDNISANVPNGVATTFRGRLMQTWNKLFGRTRDNKVAKTITNYREDGVTPNTVQAYTTSTNADDVGAAT